MEEADLKILNSLNKRKDYVELEKQILAQLKHDALLTEQRLKILDLCKEGLAKFPEEEKEAEEVADAVKEIEEEIKNE